KKIVPVVAVGNPTMTIIPETNGSVLVNSTFGFQSMKAGNFGITNGTVSAQDLYTYSETNASWIISQETWNFLAFNSQIDPCSAIVIT
ncbi:MAG: hypothetical protein ACRD6W_18530, partial [Nitrososphaerales archaeon]